MDKKLKEDITDEQEETYLEALSDSNDSEESADDKKTVKSDQSQDSGEDGESEKIEVKRLNSKKDDKVAVSDKDAEQPPEKDVEPDEDTEPEVAEIKEKKLDAEDDEADPDEMETSHEDEVEIDVEDEQQDEEHIPVTIARIDDTDTSKAVDDIVRHESDRLLKSDDEALERQFEPPVVDKSFKAKLKRVCKFWWEHRVLRYGSLLVLLVLCAAAALLPTSRYAILNMAGVRVRSSMTIVDSKTGLPLKNIPVSLQGKEKRSDEEGNLQFDGLKLGSSKLTIHKLGYADYDKQLVLGWGSNPVGNQPLVATGTQFTFLLTDWLSNKPILDAEAVSGEDAAQSDKDGKIVLTVGVLEDDTQATIKAPGYSDVILTLAEQSPEETILLVPSKSHVFVSNRSGKYDLYKIQVDGSDEKVLLAATGQEREIPYVLPSPTTKYAAYISTRDGEANSSGFIFDGLFMVDIENESFERIARSEQMQLIGWEGTKLVYVAVVEGVSAANPERSRIFSYDVETDEKKQLASSNYFNDVKLINGTVYYSVSSFAVPASAAKLFSIKPDGTEKKTALDMQVWDIVRASFDTIHFRAVDEAFATRWYTKEGSAEPKKLDVPPVVQATRNFAVSPNGQNATWVDQRDGKGVLVKYSITEEKEDVIQTAAGLNDPMYWLNDHDIIYRISTNDETADYIYNIEGGTSPKKIADVVGNRSRDFY